MSRVCALHNLGAAMWKWQLQLQMDASWKVHESWGTSSSEETDEMKVCTLISARTMRCDRISDGITPP